MAEVMAVTGLVAAVVQLIEVSSKLSLRIRDFTSKSSDDTETFRSLVVQLELLTTTLQGIESKAASKDADDRSAKAFSGVIHDLSRQMTDLGAQIEKVAPRKDDSSFEKSWKALKSLTKDEHIKKSLEQIHRNINILTLYQTTAQAQSNDLILQQLVKPHTTKSHCAPPGAGTGSFLSRAPTIDDDAFIGREAELNQLANWLVRGPGSSGQKIVSLVGMGGQGKTQLSLAFARRYAESFSGIFWLGANDLTSLEQSAEELYNNVSDSFEDRRGKSIELLRRWLSRSENNNWLMILDNYDDPKLPGARSPTGYDIREIFPAKDHGSILLTSRSLKLTFGKQLRLSKFENPEQAMAVLSQRSGKDLRLGSYHGDLHTTLADSCLDLNAQKLVQRLDGFALALATAGTQLGQTAMSPAEYLEAYNSTWLELYEDTELLEYQDRTLASTWTLSLKLVQARDQLAAKLLCFLAYFDIHKIWYELVVPTPRQDPPAWLREITQSRYRFEKAMSLLSSYSLVTLNQQHYTLHSCLHDWLSQAHASPPDAKLYPQALHCVIDTAVRDSASNPEHIARHTRWFVFDHLRFLQGSRFQTLWNHHSGDPEVAFKIGRILAEVHKHIQSHEYLQKALRLQSKRLGLEHPETTLTMRWLGYVCTKLCRHEEARDHLLQVRAAALHRLGDSHPYTTRAASLLARIYLRLGDSL